jgi:hypothetical protein
MRRLGTLTGCLIAALLSGGACLSTAGAASHQDVWLKNESGDRINPQENRSDPYSPKRTCGTCHGYATITQGYHFQQGFDEVSDRYDAKKPWVLSPGMYGRWLPYAAAERLAAKKNRDARQIDLSTYDWIGGGKLNPAKKIQSPACGWCHPGGGPMEYGRTPEGRADLSRNLIGAERGGTDLLDGDYSSRFTPDGRSRFRQSGVVEADCLICHLPGYRMDERNEQLSFRNYRWAATAGAGLGRIKGAVFSHAVPDAGPDDPRFLVGSWNFSTRPVVTYSWSDRRLFTPEGRLRGALVSRDVGAKNCLQCHAEADAKNTGTINAAPHDAHAKAGLRCTDCHPLVGQTAQDRLQHQIAKGSYPQTQVRNDLDGTDMKTCIGCHKEGKYRPARQGMPPAAPDPERRHAEKFPRALFHTYLITCNGCHATAQPARGMALLDLSAGDERGFTAEGLATVTWPRDYETQTQMPWKPWITRTRPGKGYDEAYAPHLPKRIQWFGERMSNGEVRPIPLHEVKAAFRGLKGSGFIETLRTDGVKVKISAVLKDEEISRMIAALTVRGYRSVAFLSDRIYELAGGKLTAGKYAVAADSYPVAHGVVPLEKRSVYGLAGRPGGCLECHDGKALFFGKVQVVNIREFLRHYPALQAPQVLPQMNDWGITRVPSAQ